MNFFDFILETLDWIHNFQPTLANLAQVVIAAIGVTAVALSQSPNKNVSRWACVLGLLGQPAWFYSAMVSKNYGIFIISFLYTWAWGKGFRQNFGHLRFFEISWKRDVGWSFRGTRWIKPETRDNSQ